MWVGREKRSSGEDNRWRRSDQLVVVSLERKLLVLRGPCDWSIGGVSPGVVRDPCDLVSGGGEGAMFVWQACAAPWFCKEGLSPFGVIKGISSEGNR